ncbi:MAG: 3-oxoacyl-ACP reductase FabG [Nitrospirae bacterium]|nr:3-oxoacyl-ACP reductase FabG [Nitrospirota bacterium]
MLKSSENKTCLVTGSSRGLGRAIALAFGKAGYRVVIHYKDRKNEAEDTASKIKEAVAIKADVRNSKEVKRLVDAVINKWGGIDVLVNNAGITKEALLLRTSEKDFDDIIAINLKGPFNFIQAVAPCMVKQKRGHIINIGSFTGVKGKQGLSAYSASKAGLIGLTLTTAKELDIFNIMVNAVLPGYILTDMGTQSGSKAKETALKESITGKFSKPENIAKFILYLSDTGGITGQVFNLDSRVI